MKRIYVIALLAISFVVLCAFQKTDTLMFSRIKMKTYFDEKMEVFKSNEMKKCQESALDIARLQVDSVLTGTKRLIDVDTFLLLPRPTKPEKPEFNFKVDTLNVDPIFRGQPKN